MRNLKNWIRVRVGGEVNLPGWNYDVGAELSGARVMRAVRLGRGCVAKIRRSRRKGRREEKGWGVLDGGSEYGYACTSGWGTSRHEAAYGAQGRD